MPLFWVTAKRLLSLYGESYQEVTKLVILSEKIPEDFSVWVSTDLGSDLTSCDCLGIQASDYKVNTTYWFRLELKLNRASQILSLSSLLSVLMHRLHRPKS